jgi:hypothetical protein
LRKSKIIKCYDEEEEVVKILARNIILVTLNGDGFFPVLLTEGAPV